MVPVIADNMTAQKMQVQPTIIADDMTTQRDIVGLGLTNPQTKKCIFLLTLSNATIVECHHSFD